MLINLTELFSVDGKEKDYTCDIDMNQLCTSKDAYDIVSRSPVQLHVRNLGDKKLLLTGSAEVTLQMPCDRCLEPVDIPFESGIRRRTGYVKDRKRAYRRSR